MDPRFFSLNKKKVGKKKVGGAEGAKFFLYYSSLDIWDQNAALFSTVIQAGKRIVLNDLFWVPEIEECLFVEANSQRSVNLVC